MAKFSGIIGYIETVETKPSVWETVVTEHRYFGDIERYVKKYSAGTKVNDNLSLNATVSVVADPYLLSHYGMIRFVVINDIAWKVDSVEPNYPRFTLIVGGVYNGERAGE